MSNFQPLEIVGRGTRCERPHITPWLASRAFSTVMHCSWCQSTGEVADKSVNADKVYSVGIYLAANGNISVRGHNVEVKSAQLFLCVTCVIKDQNEMKYHLKHDFGNKSPSLFDKGVMRKNTRSTCSCWCIELKCHSIVCVSPKLILCHRWWTVVYTVSSGLQVIHMIKYGICM